VHPPVKGTKKKKKKISKTKKPGERRKPSQIGSADDFKGGKGNGGVGILKERGSMRREGERVTRKYSYDRSTIQKRTKVEGGDNCLPLKVNETGYTTGGEGSSFSESQPIE